MNKKQLNLSSCQETDQNFSQCQIESHEQDTNLVFTFFTPENEQIGHVIAKLKARDFDQGPANSKQFFRTINNQESGLFDQFLHLDKYSGDISVKKLIDRERVEELTAWIYVSNYDNETLNSSYSTYDKKSIVQVVVKIIDLNDKAPIFSKKFYRTG